MSEFAAEHRLSGGGAQADDHLGLDDENLGMEPRPAGFDLSRRRFLVQAAFAARLPAEVFYGVCDVDFVARNAGFFQCFVEQPAGGADERLALVIFFVARNFAEQYQRAAARAFAKTVCVAFFKGRSPGNVRPPRGAISS